MFSLLFYLMFLILSAIHVVVCTSVESSCYLCSLPWLAAGGVMVLVSALLCVIASALARMVMDSTLPWKVQQLRTVVLYQPHFCSLDVIEHLVCTIRVMLVAS